VATGKAQDRPGERLGIDVGGWLQAVSPVVELQHIEGARVDLASGATVLPDEMACRSDPCLRLNRRSEFRDGSEAEERGTKHLTKSTSLQSCAVDLRCESDRTLALNDTWLTRRVVEQGERRHGAYGHSRGKRLFAVAQSQ
jgi:hypothetical protein